MSWYCLVKSNESFDEDVVIPAMMQKLTVAFRSASIPKDFHIFIDRDLSENHIYYFSPRVFEVGKAIIEEAGAKPCLETPDVNGLREIKL